MRFDARCDLQIAPARGLTVIRDPNARLYVEMRSRNDAALAWNHLLGFLYLYGCNEEHVNRVANDHGLEFVRGYDSELTMPFPDLNEKARERQCDNGRKVGRWSIRTSNDAGALTGPWIEMAYRKLERPAPLREGALDGTFLARAA